jgi:replicative DNA helicase
LLGWSLTSVPGMEHFRAAERALASALVLGAADPRELAGRLRPSDFTDPAAGVLFEVALQASGSARSLAQELPALLRQEGQLRQDGYPISQLLDWLPQLPTRVHPEAWATLVVAGAIGRQVRASGDRLQQSAEAALDGRCTPGQLLAQVAAQRAALASSSRRWENLPARWRDTIPARAAEGPSDAAVVTVGNEEGGDRERVLLAGLVAAPQVLGRVPWLREEDFVDRACGEVFGTLRRLHEFGHPVDVVTLAAACDRLPPAPDRESPAQVVSGLRPEHALPSSVPFLARRVVGLAISRDVRAAGQDLADFAAAPAAAGGLGGALLTTVQRRLDALRPHAVRWENAASDITIRSDGGRTRTGRLASAKRRPPGAQRVPPLDRHAG